MRKTKFNLLRCCVAGTLLGMIAGADAQPAKSDAAKAEATGKKTEGKSKAKAKESPARTASAKNQPEKESATKDAASKKDDAAKKDSAAKTMPVLPGGKVATEIGDDPQPPNMPHRSSFEMSAEQIERFKKFLPKSYAKLIKRERFHMVSIGDSVLEMSARKGADDGALKSYAGVFATELATQFYYTAGVRVIRPATSKTPKNAPKAPIPVLGPDITLRVLPRPGKLMIHAMQTITTVGMESQPDLVTVSFGLSDAIAGLNPALYAKALQEVIETVRSKGAELIVLGPTLTIDDPAEESLGLTRAYLDTMREIATDSGVLFVDLGDLSSLVAVSDTVTEPEVVYDQIVRQYRRFFAQTDPPDFIHPQPEMHRILGDNIFNGLISGPKPSPWSVSGATATLESADKFTLHYDLKNPSDKDMQLSVLPLVVRDWKPVDATPQIELKAGASTALQVSYARRSAASGGLPSHEPMLRLPILISGAGMTRIEDLRAELRPFTLLWKLETMFNQEKSFQIENLLCNTSAAPLRGTWTAEWLGQKCNGDFSLAAGEKKPLAISFNVPHPSDPWRQTSPVVVEIAAAGMKLHFDRTIEVSRNIGMKEMVSLTPLSDPDKAPDNEAGVAGVRMRVDADAESLYLTYEISGLNLEDAGAGAFDYSLALDARSYGKRLGFGAIDSLRLTGHAEDGLYRFESPPPWVFGTGYASVFDPQYIKGQLGSTLGGARRFTVTIPRSYLYLHEWAIGNGNSQLGIRSAISFWKGPRDGVPSGDHPLDLNFSLVANRRHPDDAEGLAVIELTNKSTERWTVNPF